MRTKPQTSNIELQTFPFLVLYLNMYKLDKKISGIKTYKQAEESKKFAPDVTLSERLKQAWYLTCMAYGIDPENVPGMQKRLISIQKKQD